MFAAFRRWRRARHKLVVSTIAPMQTGSLFERCANAAGWLRGPARRPA